MIKKIVDGGLCNLNYQIKDGKLWYKRRLVLLKNSRFILDLLKECHDSKLGIHAGVLRTLKREQQSFY